MGVKPPTSGGALSTMAESRGYLSLGCARTKTHARGDFIMLMIALVLTLAQIPRTDAQLLPPAPAPGVVAPVRAPAPGPIPAVSPGVVAPAPLPPQTPLQQSQHVVQALRGNNFTAVAQLIQTYLPVLRLNTTLFVPTNAALAAVPAGTPLLPIILYHAAAPQYTYSQLLALPVGARLPTSLGNNSILVTNNAPDNFQVDNVRIVVADACSSTVYNLQVSCHGVERVLNASLYGNSTATTNAPAPAPLGVPSPVAGPVPTLAPFLPPIPFVAPVPSPPAPGPDGSVVGETPPAESPTDTDSSASGAASIRELISYPTCRHLIFVVYLGVVSVGLSIF